MAELRAIEFVNRLIDEGRCRAAPARTNTAASTCIASCSRAWASASPRPPMQNDYEFFQLLRKLGQRAARRFLDEHYANIGASSIDLNAEVIPSGGSGSAPQRSRPEAKPGARVIEIRPP